MRNMALLNRVYLGLAAVVCLLNAGCVCPPEMEPSVILRYQQAMEKRSPVARSGQEYEVGFLQPAKEVTGPSFAVKEIVDKKGKRKAIRLSLEDAVVRALANNSDIQVVSFDPAISREDVTRAAARFDYEMFGGFSYESGDRQSDSAAVAGQSDTRRWQLGMRKQTTTGAQASLSWNLSRSWDDVALGTLSTEYEPTVELQISQPLLRDGWQDVNLAELRLSSVNYQISMEAFRQQVESIVTEVYRAYWELARARRALEIQEGLLAKTIETYDRVFERFKAGLDATKVQTKQAESAVASRRADLVRARKAVGDAEDLLGRLVGHSQVNVLGEYEIIPITLLTDAKVHVDVRDQLLTALKHSPVLQQARLFIEGTDINVTVAKNQVLPRLDLTGGVVVQAQEGGVHSAHRTLTRGDYVSYSVGLTFEYPIGNRQRKAALRSRLLDKRKALASLQAQADQVALQIQERVRQIETAYREVEMRRVAVASARDQLQALEDTEEIRGRLSPEFLNVKLQAQETIAREAQAEVAALAIYNAALVELRRETGTVLELERVRVMLPSKDGEMEWPAWVPPVVKKQEDAKPNAAPSKPADKTENKSNQQDKG